jgi:hypothetical protein
LGRQQALALLGKKLEPLRGDKALPDSLRRLPVSSVIAPSNTAYARWLDDAGAQLYLKAMAAWTRQMPTEQCGKVLGPGSEDATDLDLMLNLADSATVDTWAGILTRIVRARALGHAAGRVATQAEMQRGIMLAIGRLSADDQTRLITIARNPPPTPADGCWSVQQIFGALAALPADTLGPVARTMLGATAAEGGH